MLIIQRPDELSLSGNLKEFIIQTTEQILFILKQGNDIVLSQRYDPGADGKISIDLKDIVHSRLSFQFIETDTCYKQNNLSSLFTASINGTVISFRVIRSGVDRLADTAANFLTQNFLTWQPQVKPVTYYSPEFLTYFAVINCTVKIKAYYTNADGKVTGNETIELAQLAEGFAYTIPLQYSIINAKFSDKKPGFYDAWTEDGNGNRLTYIQRYYASPMFSESEQWILFENSLGGIDTFRAYGSAELQVEHTHNIAEIEEISSEYRIDTERKFQKNTGHLDDYQRRWLLDFFPAIKKYIYTGSFLRSIVVVEDNVQYTDNDLPSNYTFTYKYADAKPLLNLPRAQVVPSDLNIAIPDLGSFTVPPRLVEFPRLPLSEGALFPVQNPYSENWATTTAGSIADFVSAWITGSYEGDGGIGHKHDNLDLLQILSYIDGYLKVDNKNINAGYSDESGVARLLETTNFIRSMIAGKGAGVDADGNMQVESLEVRSYMKVMELIYNRLSAMEGDFVFTESGTVDTIEQIDSSTYRLNIRKRWENDFTAFREGDVLRGVINTLTSNGEYSTAYMRVLSVNTTANDITVSVYPDSEVPAKKNHPPTALMVLQRWGNTVSTERQSTWYLSSYEGRIVWLTGVTKPILEEHNYGSFYGKPVNLSIFKDKPINFDQPYLYVRGLAVQDLIRVDYVGNPIKDIRDRGSWVAAPEEPYRNLSNLQDDVWHLGCRWRCLVDGTDQEPKWNATDWQMIEGNSNLSMSFSSSAGDMFFAGQVSTLVTPYVFLGNIDISTDVAPNDWEWIRDSGNVTEDNAWSVAHAANGRQLELSNEDMGSNWGTTRKVAFVCTAYIRDGEGIVSEGIQNRVIV